LVIVNGITEEASRNEACPGPPEEKLGRVIEVRTNVIAFFWQQRSNGDDP
jgi:hypothetical protein